MKFQIVVGSFLGEWDKDDRAPEFDTCGEAVEYIKENIEQYSYLKDGRKRSDTPLICPIFEEAS